MTCPTAPAFASTVLAAARQVPASARFGDDKVYISDLWELTRDASSLPAFKDQLWAAHRAGQLMLARGDLPHLMDRTKLDASELVVDFSTFHFVLVTV